MLMKELVLAVLTLPVFLATPLRSVAIFHIPRPVAHETLQAYFVKCGHDFLTLLVAYRQQQA